VIYAWISSPSPAFHVHLQVDWSRVQNTWMTASAAGPVFFGRYREGRDKLIEGRVITLTSTPSSRRRRGKAVAGDGRAVSEVYEMIKTLL